MLSKKEIEKILDVNEDIITYKADKDFRCLTSTEKALIENNRKIKKYIEQLEADNYEQNNIINSYIEREQKLIEKLEEDINVDKIQWHDELGRIIKEEPKSRLVSRKTYAQEILEIVKGEKNE